MFWFGKNNHFVGPDWRPEVHDSDGLEMLLASGERIWRPLNNPPRVTANSFVADGLRGFGLAQRERSFEEYQDDGVFYEKRATLWVEPQGDWGAGLGDAGRALRPTTRSTTTSSPSGTRRARPAGMSYDLDYKLNWVADSPPQTVARFIAARLGVGGVPGQPRPPNVVKFVLDLDGKGLEELDRSSGVEAVVGASRGTLDLIFAFPIATTTRWRVNFDLDIGPPDPERRPDRPADLPAPRRPGDVGDLDLPGVPVPAARASGRARLTGGSAKHRGHPCDRRVQLGRSRLGDFQWRRQFPLAGSRRERTATWSLRLGHLPREPGRISCPQIAFPPKDQRRTERHQPHLTRHRDRKCAGVERYLLGLADRGHGGVVRHAWAKYPNLKHVVSHAMLDPFRRTDPSNRFHWERFKRWYWKLRKSPCQSSWRWLVYDARRLARLVLHGQARFRCKIGLNMGLLLPGARLGAAATSMRCSLPLQSEFGPWPERSALTCAKLKPANLL